MKNILKYLAIAIGSICTFIVAIFMYFVIEAWHKDSSARVACEGSEDFVVVRSKIKDALASGIIDQDVVDRENPRIDEALKQCSWGDTRQSRAILLEVMFGIELGSDATHDRKVNSGESEKNQQNK